MLCNIVKPNLICSEQIFGIHLEVKVIRNWELTVVKDPKLLPMESKGSDQTMQMHRLVQVFASQISSKIFMIGILKISTLNHLKTGLLEQSIAQI